VNKKIYLVYYGFLDKNWHKNVSWLSHDDIFIYFYNLIDDEITIPEIRLIAGKWE